MRKFLSFLPIIALVFLGISANAQTTLINSNFEPGDPTGWLFAQGGTGNRWVIGTGTNNGGTQSAYISSDGSTYAYNNASATTAVHMYKSVTFPAGEGAILLSFDIKGIGDVDGTNWDYVRVSLTTAAPVSGTFPVVGDQQPVVLSGYSAWNKYWVAIPSSFAGLTRNLVFTFRSDASAGFSSLAIDNLTLTTATASPLSGTKTIKTSGGDYSSFSEAIAKLNANGVAAGGVTFNVDAGVTFDETPSAITVSAASPDYITFQKSGVGSNPKIRAMGTGNIRVTSTTTVTDDVDAVIAIFGGDRIKFDGIDVEGADNGGSTSVPSAIDLGFYIYNASATNGAQDNIIQNSTITLNKTGQTASRGILQNTTTTATNATGANSGNKYYNITISNVYAGIQLTGTAAFPDLGTEVGTTGGGTTTIGGATANDIGNSTTQTYGIRATAQSGIKIFNTEIRNVTGTSTSAVDGIFIDNTGSGTVSVGTNEIYNNKIHDIKSTSTSTTSHVVSGIRVNLTNNAGSIARVYNNFIYALDNASANTTSRQLIGLRLQDGGTGTASTFHVDFNSVRLQPTGVSCSNSCLEIGTSSPVINVRNNILANFTPAQTTVKHYCVASTSTTAVGGAGSTWNRNVLHVNNTTNGFTGVGSTTDYATLANWQGRTDAPDANSKNQNPQYESATDLHISTSNATPVESSATYFSGAITWVTTDIDGNARHGSTPDIGADEGTFVSLVTNDIQPTVFITPVNGNTYPSGSTFTPQVTYVNNGTAAQSGVTVRFKIINPGTTEVYNQTATISSVAAGASTNISFTALTGTELSGAGTYTIQAIAELGGDEVASNDILNGTITVEAPLAGDYHIGSAQSAPFNTLTNAVARLNAVGISNDVNFILDDATYSGSETFPITINAFSRTGAADDLVTIRPNAGTAVSISGSSAVSSILKLNGADYIVVDGLNSGGASLTIENTNTSAGAAAIWLASTGAGAGATNNTIRNTNIKGAAAQNAVTTVTYGIVVAGSTLATTVGSTTAGDDNDNNTIEYNAITKVRYGVYFRGGASPNLNTGNKIRNNTIGSATAMDANIIGKAGILVREEDGIQILDNEIRNIGTDFTTFSSGTDRFGIAAGTDATWAMSVVFLKNAQILRNKIHDFTEEATNSAVGIGLFADGTSATNNLVANNVIYGLKSNAATDQTVGIGLAGGNGDNILFNSIYLYGDGDPSSGSTATTSSAVGITLYSTSVTNATVKNNVVHMNVTSSSSPAVKNSCFNLPTGYALGTGSIDNNAWYANSSNTQSNIGSVGVTTTAASGTFYSTANDWKAATPGAADDNSIFTDPLFNGTTDLRPNLSSPLLNAGATGTGITTDYLGVTRGTGSPTFPTIGAYEGAIDQSGPYITYTALDNGDNTNRTLIATITDPSGVETAAGSEPRIYYRKGASGAYYSATATSVAGDDYSFTIDYANVTGGSVATGDIIQYYVAAQDVNGFISTSPTGGSGTPPPGNTAPSTPNQYTIVGLYTWNGGSNDFTDPNNWTPTRSATAATDILIFDGSVTPNATVNNIPSQTVNRVRFINNVTADLDGAAANNDLTFSGSSAVTVFLIEAGSTVNIGATTALDLLYGSSSGQIGTISGTLNLNAGSTFTFTNGATTVTNGGVFHNLGATFTGVSTSTFVVASGGRYQHGVNGGTMPAANYQAGSNVWVTGITSATSITWTSVNLANANFEWNSPSQTSAFNLAGSITSYGSLSVVNTGTGTFQTAASTSISVSGNASISGGTWRVSGSATTITITGTLSQSGGTIAKTNSGNLTISAASISQTAGTISHTTTGIFTLNSSSGNTTVAGTVDGGATGSLVFQFNAASGNQTLTTTGATISNQVGITVNKAAGIVNLADNFTINSGGVLTLTGTTSILNLNGNTLTLAGSASGTGSIRGSSTSNFTATTGTGTINFDPSTPGTTNALGTLTKSGAGTLTLGSGLNVHTAITVSAGTLNLNAQDVVMKAGTYPAVAVISQVLGTLSGASNVQVERSLPASQRAYRQLAPGVTTTSTIRTNWQENQNNTNSTNSNTNPGYGTHITGSTSGANGFDYTAGGGASLFTHQAGTANSGGGSFVAIGNTNSNTLSATTAYRLFLRGSRAADLHTNQGTPGNPVAIDATILRARGTLTTGAVTFNTASGHFGATPAADQSAFIPNPYWAVVDFNKLTLTDVKPTYYLFDPNIGYRGGYVSYTYDPLNPTLDGTTTVETGGPGSSAVSRFIQPGQAIFVENKSAAQGFTGSPEVVFNEDDKGSGFTNTFRTSPNAASLIRIKLYNNTTLMDGVTAAFKNNYNDAIGLEDAAKFPNPDENLAINRNKVQLGLEGRPDVATTDTIALNLWKLFTSGTHELKFKADNFDAEVTGYVWDKYTNQTHALNMSGEVSVPFTFTATDSASFYNRFYVVFRNNATLPVSITSVKAYQKNTGVQVEWNVASESNINRYEVEKSADGRTFTIAGTVAARGNNNSSVSYNWFDAQPINGANYYRVKVVERNGAVKYTGIVRVNIGKAGAVFTMYPNPVKGDVVTLSLNTEKGDYTVEMYNAAGQKVKAERLQHGGGSAAYTIALPNVSAGVYTIRLFGKDVNTQQTIIVENK